MRITGWHIDGFGVFADHEVTGIPPDLTVVIGPNEAGKSTLLDFLRGVLFGFPDGSGPDREHPPLRGGRHGGRVLVEAGGQELAIERHRSGRGPVVHFPDGTQGDEEALDQLLGHADATLFRNVFAFSLTELESFGSLDTTAVRERIATAGIIGAGRSARQAVAALDQRRDVLWRPRAGAAEIARLAAEVHRAQEALDAATRAAEEHARSVADEQARRAELAHLAARADDLRAAVRRWATLLDLWPDEAEAAAARAGLARLEEVPPAPPNAEARLERARSAVTAAEVAVEERLAELAALDQRLVPLQIALLPDGVADAARALASDLSAYRTQVARQAEVERARRAAEQRFADERARLGGDWDLDRIAAFSAPIPAAEEVRSQGQRLDRVAERLAVLEEELEAVDQQVAALQAEERRSQEQLRRFAGVPLAAELDEREDLTRRLRAVVTDHGWASARLDTVLRARDDLRQTPGRARGRTLAWVRPALFVLAGLLVGGAATAVVLGQVVLAAAAGLAAVVVAVLAALLGPGGLPAAARASAAHEEAGDRMRAVSAEVDTHQQQVDALAAEAAGLAGRLGLPDLPRPIDVEEHTALLIRQREARTEADRIGREVTTTAAARRQAERAQATLQEDLAAARAALAGEEQRWERWKNDHALPGQLGPQGVLDFFAAMERARDALRQLRAAEADAAELAAQVAAFEQRSRGLLERVGIPVSASSADLVRAVLQLQERAARDEVARRDRVSIEAQRAEAAERLRVAEQRLGLHRTSLQELFAEVGAADEEEARHRIAVARAREELEERLAVRTARIRARAGQGPAADLLLAELQRGDADGWRAARDQAEAELARLETEREDAVRAHHDAQRLVAAREGSADVPRAALELAGLRTELAEAAADWRRLTLARALILDTLERYERERQPAVMTRASALFAQVTEGRYAHVAFHEDGLDVVDRQGQRLDIGVLSRGTAEQLYLCLRLGLAEEFAATQAALPLVLDDVLVNFDPQRALGMATAIATVAQHNQVMLFTCHPHVVDLLRTVRPSARVVQLERAEADPARAIA